MASWCLLEHRSVQARPLRVPLLVGLVQAVASTVGVASSGILCHCASSSTPFCQRPKPRAPPLRNRWASLSSSSGVEVLSALCLGAAEFAELSEVVSALLFF